MEKRLIQFVVLLSILIFGWRAWNPFWATHLDRAVDPDNEDTVIFEIERGSSAKRIAKNLAKADLIERRYHFLRAIKEYELEQSLRYGNFVLSPSMTLDEIITILSTEGSGERALTFIEGWTIQDMDDYLVAQGLISEGAFRRCIYNCSFDYDFLSENGKTVSNLEGYLFPDTYFINSASFSVESLINTMLTNFDRKLTDEMEVAIKASGRSIEETIIVASMIEKEVRTSADIPIVGGIIWKRLDADWALGIDATLLYVQDDNILTADDLASYTPYNTRLYKGLPPSAISNPGLASIEGAVYPENSDYWFYLTTLDTGEVIYSITNEEHNANKAKYL